MTIVMLGFAAEGYGQDKVKPDEPKHNRDKGLYYNAAKEKILGNYDQAVILFKKYLELNPDDAAAMYELADIYKNQDKLDEALTLAEKAVSLDDENKWYKIRLMEIYQAKGRYSDVIPLIEQLIARDPNNISYYQDLALSYLYVGDYKSAIKTYNSIEEKVGVTEEISVQKEKVYLLTGKKDKAINEIEQLSHAYPDETRYLEMLAELYMQNQMSDQALAIYNKILEIDPEDPYINISLSDYYRKKGDSAKSFEHLKAGFANPALDIDAEVQILLAYYSVNEIYNDYKDDAFTLAEIMVKAHPEAPKAHSIYGDLLFQDKKYEEARQSFRKVISLDSTKYLVWEQLLFTESELLDFNAMAGESERALQLFPQQPVLYLFAGAAQFQLKNHQGAIDYFKNGANFVVGNDKLLSQFYAYMGDTYFQLKDHEASDEAYQKVLKIDSNNALVLNNYAYYLSLRSKDLDKAAEMAKKAVDLDPENGANQDTYGWVLYKLDRYEEAKDWIGKAIQNREESAVVIEHYGDVLWKLGDQKEAVKYWEKARKTGEGSEFLDKKLKDKMLYE